MSSNLPNADYGQAGHGIGQRQQPVVIPDNLEPGQGPAQVSQGEKGPPLSQPVLDDWFGQLSEHERELVGRVIQRGQRNLDKDRRSRELVLSANTNGSGNCVAALYEVRGGLVGALTRATVALNDTTTYNPSNFFGAAGAYMFLARATAGAAGAGAAALWRGMVCFGPETSTAASPFLPGQWTFEDSQAPVFKNGETIYLVVVGTAAIANQTLNVTLKLEEQDL